MMKKLISTQFLTLSPQEPVHPQTNVSAFKTSTVEPEWFISDLGPEIYTGCLTSLSQKSNTAYPEAPEPLGNLSGSKETKNEQKES